MLVEVQFRPVIFVLQVIKVIIFQIQHVQHKKLNNLMLVLHQYRFLAHVVRVNIKLKTVIHVVQSNHARVAGIKVHHVLQVVIEYVVHVLHVLGVKL